MQSDGKKASYNPAATLASLLGKREKLQEELHNIEKQVYELETSYLQESSHFGNALKGFDGFLSASKNTTNSQCWTILIHSGSQHLPFSAKLSYFSNESILRGVVRGSPGRWRALQWPEITGGGEEEIKANLERERSIGAQANCWTGGSFFSHYIYDTLYRPQEYWSPSKLLDRWLVLLNSARSDISLSAVCGLSTGSTLVEMELSLQEDNHLDDPMTSAASPAEEQGVGRDDGRSDLGQGRPKGGGLATNGQGKPKKGRAGGRDAKKIRMSSDLDPEDEDDPDLGLR
ncbi:hypothetical protein TEA_026514 [Camellia sinensis var. sinensis]|uniref:Chromatin modification-related protein MEAF6 n=1 Tax=Camellia sinensis var. sinensis TaxID=542762 RepID=A0A4S4E676_CAMSN|nr:hypothetical protein TEA_026514 [Camellia sinensis var. sinensis]